MLKSKKILIKSIRKSKKKCKNYFKEVIKTNNIEDVKNSSYFTLERINKKYEVLRRI